MSVANIPVVDQRRLLDDLCRNDFATFVHRAFCELVPGHAYKPNWHLFAIFHALERCRRGETNRLIITMPPRHLKSICASVALPAYLLALDPTVRVVAASYSTELANKHAGDCRRVMGSPWYRRTFPRTRLSRIKNQEHNFETTRGGGRFSTSVGATLTGRGGGFIVIDDPLKPEDALSKTRREAVNSWFDSTLYSRLDDKSKDVIILIMQRLHVEDLVAHVQKTEHWEHLNLPAIAEVEERVAVGNGRYHERLPGDLLHPEREPIEIISAMQRRMGSYNFSAQYQQQPIPPEGEIIKLRWFRRYDSAPAKSGRDRIVQSWDTASKGEELSDYCVCTTWLLHGDEHYLLNVFREQLDYPELRRKVIEQAQAFRADTIVIEDKGTGTGLLADLRANRPSGVRRPIPYNPLGDKLTRIATHSALIEAGQVLLPARASWLEAFEQEMLLFPCGSNDDQVDSVSQYLGWHADRDRHGVTFIHDPI